MCGICGVAELDHDARASLANVEAMARVLVHRGPDAAGYHGDSRVALGFRRLSIVDLSGGHQPMSNEDGSIWIVFNGEIYNHLALRADLERQGHRYASRSDTETIIHLYEQYGQGCVEHLRGMFAFVIWDSVKQRLFCARDRLGIKPFYYTLAAGRFAFASEMKALFELPWLRARMNRSALPEFFALGYLSSQETMFEGISRLLPGHCLSLDLNERSPQSYIERYWDLRIAPEDTEESDSDYIDQFRELFTESVRLRLMSDVPLGVFLSGGLDSSSIAAATVGLLKGGVKTFSVGYDDERSNELPFARRTAEFLGTDHKEILLGPRTFFNFIPRLVWHEDEPIVWPSSIALHAVSRLAGETVKVVLSGEGADELFAGYTRYPVTLFNMRCGRAYERMIPSGIGRWVRNALDRRASGGALWRKLRHSFLHYPSAFEKIYFDNFLSVFSADAQAELFTAAVSEELSGVSPYAASLACFDSGDSRADLLTRLLALDIKTYLQELLMKQDQMSMAASVESRVPFLDHKLVEFGLRVPARLKVKLLSGKYIVRQAMKHRLPPEVLRRSKKGFPTPIARWLRHQLFDSVAPILTDGRMAERGIISSRYVRDLLEGHRAGRIDATDRIWRLLNFELWNRIFLDRDWSGSESSPFAAAAPAIAHG